jgi:uncharacterized protein
MRGLIATSTPLEIGYICEEATGISAHVMLPTELTARIKERMADDLIEVL